MYIEEFPGCCAADVICGLRSSGKTAKQLLTEYLKNGVRDGYYDYWERKNLPKDIKLPAFVLFSEITQLKRNGKWTNRGTALYPTGYGKKLAKYIKDNKLGTVVASPCRVNVGKHDDHKDTLYMWAPNEKAVRKFAKDNKII